MKLKQMLLILGSGIVLLTGCMGGGLTLTDDGENFFEKNHAAFYLGEVNVVSENEEKSLQAGFQDAQKTQKLLESQLIGETLRQAKPEGADGVKVVVNLKYERIFSWGVSDSLASIQYEGNVKLENNGIILGSYPIRGTVQDTSIAGDFKAMFASNESKDDTEYFRVIAQTILDALPKS